MLHKAKDLFGATIKATDDDHIGALHDFYFDAEEWAVRYLVADVGSWLFGRRVLLAPDSVQSAQWSDKVFPVNLTRQQVKDSPEIDLAKPISRQYQADLHEHYGWPAYWGADAMPYSAGGGITPAIQPTIEPTPASDMPAEMIEALEQSDHAPLQSIREMSGYPIEATDGAIGHISDFFIDDENWAIRYVLIATGNWLPDQQVLLSTAWLDGVDWNEKRVYAKLTKAQIEHSPAYNPTAPIARSDEAALHEYYGYPVYWK